MLTFEPDMQEQNTKKVKTIRASTVISISLVLLMLGLLGLILLHARNLSNFVKENITLSVIVHEQANETDILKLEKELKTFPMIKSTTYVTKEMAANKLAKDLGEDFVSFLGYNPLLSSIDVSLKADYANKAGVANFENRLKNNPLVKEIYYQKNLIDSVNENLGAISLAFLIFAGVLLVVAIALINNTIQLAMYSQRFLIKSMQLIGATHNYVRKPYLIAGLLHGILGGLISIVLVLVTLYFAQQQIPELVVLQNYTEFIALCLGILGIGIFISISSTYFAVTRYLKLKAYDLY